MTRHQYGISAVVPQTSFRGETSGDVANCFLWLQRSKWLIFTPSLISGFRQEHIWNLALFVFVYSNIACVADFRDLTSVSNVREAAPISGTLRSNYAEGNENVKKSIGFISKTTTLHVHHAFLYISLPFLHDYDVKMPNFAFYGERKQATTKFNFSF